MKCKHIQGNIPPSPTWCIAQITPTDVSAGDGHTDTHISNYVIRYAMMNHSQMSAQGSVTPSWPTLMYETRPALCVCVCDLMCVRYHWVCVLCVGGVYLETWLEFKAQVVSASVYRRCAYAYVPYSTHACIYEHCGAHSIHMHTV